MTINLLSMMKIDTPHIYLKTCSYHLFVVMTRKNKSL